MPITPYLPEDNSVFEPIALAAMSQAFEEACTALNIPLSEPHDREMIAMRVIDLARTGVIDAKALRNRVLFEARSKE